MSLHFRDEGSGPPLVLLHGLGASSRVFDSVHERAKAHRRVLSIDLPCTARSGPWAASTPHAIAAELTRFLDRQRVGEFEFFGHSFGGVIGLQLASELGSRITRLTVASVPALGLPAELKALLDNPIAEATMRWFGGMPVWRPALRSYLSLIWGDTKKLGDAHLAIYEEAISAPGFSEHMLMALRSLGAWKLPVERLAALSMPRTVLWGDRDRLVSVIQGEQLSIAIGAKLRVLDGVGHCVPEEAPDHLASVLFDG